MISNYQKLVNKLIARLLLFNIIQIIEHPQLYGK